MPTYEYLCTSCGHEWEFEQSIKDEPQKICQKCNQETAKRQISRGAGFILKGGGWYRDLYASGSNKQASKGESSESKPADSGGSSEKKADAGGGDSKASTSGGSTSTPAATSSTPSSTPSTST